MPAKRTSGHIVEDEGTAVAQAAFLDFVGAGVSVATASGKTTVTIPTSGTPTDGWVDDTAATWTRTANQTFTVTGDRTAVFTKGTRLKWTQTTVKYGVVISSSHAAGTTTVTIATNSDYVLTAAAISANYYSYVLCPAGYPTWFNYAPTNETGWSTANPFTVARFAVEGTKVILLILATGTSDSTTTQFDAPINCAAAWVGIAQGAIMGINNSVNLYARWYFNTATQLKFGVSATSDAWTASNVKAVQGFLIYEMA